MVELTAWPGIGDEDLLVAVANTAHGEPGEPDELADAAGMRTWWSGLGLALPADGGPRRPDAAESLAMLRALRAVIRGLALRNNGFETEVDTAVLDGLTLRLDLGGTPSLRADGPADLIRDVGAATVTALLRANARPGWPRLKACRGEDCRWVYVDASRNASRRWCDMAACGNRAKSASFRRRHRTGDATAAASASASA
ncbi:CGNR zinc finger domain-containing protein [Frankia sp. AgKG'84/4]|uniref:CGNR zinc finger domain-containing protein n=1 Tax=Frankia sp. AgKG'84/4 TaxID=573490 RepID=UPI00201057E7|nr:CGNR zinc finger domain-containing protein [Frankia sp. AgKG'84/4]MCL9793817.1 CGNR zinc finger domain-containing protein [Frankia sp. AgKG'84/4]